MMAEGRFELGVVVATPGATTAFREAGEIEFTYLVRHLLGDWGEVDGHDRRANEAALRNGTRLLSAYDTPAGRVWIITEADRTSTCVLLPEEY